MVENNPEQLDELTPQQLIAEIQQISAQYAAEVPGTRRSWPESIRARILALGRLGVPKRKIAELTGIPPATVFLWCRGLPRARRSSKERFIQLPGPSIPTARLPSLSPTVGLEVSGLSGLRLQTPNGFLIEGVRSVAELAQLYRELCR